MWVFKTFHIDPLYFPGDSNFVNLGLFSLLLNLAKDFTIFSIFFEESSLWLILWIVILSLFYQPLSQCLLLLTTYYTWFAITFFFFWSGTWVYVFVGSCSGWQEFGNSFLLTTYGFAGLFWWTCWVCFLPLLGSNFSYKISFFLCTHLGTVFVPPLYVIFFYVSSAVMTWLSWIALIHAYLVMVIFPHPF